MNQDNMELTALQFLIVCPLVFLAGLVDAMAGGGGLISLPAYFFAGLPPHAAIATNKLSSTLGTLVATVRYALFGYMVKRFVVAGVACGLVGSAIGVGLLCFAAGCLFAWKAQVQHRELEEAAAAEAARSKKRRKKGRR